MNPRWQRKKGQPVWVMGVLNCTPDSFSDGSRDGASVLVQRAKEMVEQGADIIDVGGESTRPQAKQVSLEEELLRVLPVVEGLVASGIPVSIDTTKAEVMHQAIAAGAELVNDISALRFDEESLAVVASTGVDVCLMHMQGAPQNMQDNPNYEDVISDVIHFFEQRVEACLEAGVHASSILLDPGIGFGKRMEDNISLISNLGTMKSKFGLPILLGASRKSFLGAMTGAEVQDRELETAVVSGIGIFNGADMIRVHDCLLHKKTAVVASHLMDAKLTQDEPVKCC